MPTPKKVPPHPKASQKHGIVTYDDLEKHYKKYNPSSIVKGSTSPGEAFIVRLPDQNAIHFYNYDNTGKVIFGGQGYYDKHSKWFREQKETDESVIFSIISLVNSVKNRQQQ